VLELGDEPALANRLWPDRASARSAPRGRIDLAFCQDCGVGHNRAFEPSLLTYDRHYENALHHSATFTRYAERLADDLVVRHHLGGRRLLELGSGSGDFLRRLTAAAGPGTTAIGLDPGAAPTGEDDRPRFVNSLEPGRIEADFVCARHVLEHVVDPVRTLAELRAATPRDGAMTLYLEVPDGSHMVRTAGIWDVVYEHPWYFTEPSLERLLGRAGFEVTDTGSAFAGQYLWMEAVSRRGRSESSPTTRSEAHGTRSATLRSARHFAERARATIQWWADEVRRLARGGVAVWGIGSKGVTFLNRVADTRLVTHAVDLNPRKHGRFVAGTGHRVAPPVALTERPPSTVLIMNGNYRAEVASQLSSLGSTAELVVVDEAVCAPTV
jgi:hypothetical protein